MRRDLPPEETDKELNDLKFVELTTDPDFVRLNKGKYAVIADGELVGVYRDEQIAITEGKNIKPNSNRLVQVVGYEHVIDDEGHRLDDVEDLDPKIN